MITKNILIYFRTLTKNIFLFILNTIGLSIGIAACILCFLHIQNELSYDQFNSKTDRIYRVVTGDVTTGDGWVKVSAPIPPIIKDEIPEVDEYSRFTKITYNSKITVRYEDKVFNEEKFFMTDPAFFKIFDYKLISGNIDRLLTDPNSVLLSQSVTQRYFGTEDPIGKVIRVNNQFEFVVEGVFDDVPDNSHIDFDFLISFQNLERIFPGTSLTGNFSQFNYYAYVLLLPGVNKEIVERKIQKIQIDLGNNSEFDLADIGLQSLSDIHFQDNRGNHKPSYNPKYLYIYIAVALAILVISFINFINLSIAGSTKRVKEVGVRKVIGASKNQLITQFISESLIITSLSVCFSLLLIQYILLPVTNDVLNSRMIISYSDPNFIAILLLLVLVLSFISGSYIAFFVSSFKPVDALKGALKIGARGTGFKNLLLGIQFSISIMLILGSIFIYKQLLFIKKKDIGLKTEQVLSISLFNQEARDKSTILRSEYNEFSWVKGVTASRFVIGSANWHQNVWWEGQEDEVSMFLIMADQYVVNTLDLRLIEGNMEVMETPLTDGETRYIINESAKKLIGWDIATNQPFTAYGKNRIGKVYGVVEDFNFQSLHHSVAPCVIVISERLSPSNLLVKIESDDLQLAIKDLEKTFKTVIPDTPFEYRFLDDQYNQLYESETQTAKIIGFLTLVAIILSLLGLYGLLTFVVQERTKEMAIRKVLGVRLIDIIYLLSNNFLKLLIIANIFAIPIVWIIMRNWLNSFNYKIELNIGIFAFTSLLIWLFVLITISFNVFQVSRIDPVEGLKHQ